MQKLTLNLTALGVLMGLQSCQLIEEELSSSSSNNSSSEHSSSAVSSSSDANTLYDTRDGQSYKVVRIGKQVWMAENLNFGTLDSTFPQKAGTKYCYQNSQAECKIGGGLYQWDIAMNVPKDCQSSSCATLIKPQHQGICPEGWHMPTSDEWKKLGDALGGMDIAGGKMKLNKTSYPLFNTIANDGNSSGFSAFPNGSIYNGGRFAYHGDGTSNGGGGVWWSTDEYSGDYTNAWRFYVNNQSAQLYVSANHDKWDGMSVRCLKNSLE